jgi:hypothetical protein
MAEAMSFGSTIACATAYSIFLVGRDSFAVGMFCFERIVAPSATDCAIIQEHSLSDRDNWQWLASKPDTKAPHKKPTSS